MESLEAAVARDFLEETGIRLLRPADLCPAEALALYIVLYHVPLITVQSTLESTLLSSTRKADSFDVYGQFSEKS
jgi:hypothetical protein